MKGKSAKVKSKNCLSIAANQYIHHNVDKLSRIYPAGMRTDSSNYNPVPLWNSGCQIGTALGDIYIYMSQNSLHFEGRSLCKICTLPLIRKKFNVCFCLAKWGFTWAAVMRYSNVFRRVERYSNVFQSLLFPVSCNLSRSYILLKLHPRYTVHFSL